MVCLAVPFEGELPRQRDLAHLARPQKRQHRKLAESSSGISWYQSFVRGRRAKLCLGEEVCAGFKDSPLF
jgi:hypothetical protein